jgi:hypothetical protein
LSARDLSWAEGAELPVADEVDDVEGDADDAAFESQAVTSKTNRTEQRFIGAANHGARIACQGWNLTMKVSRPMPLMGV